ncbi:hypothetical protein GC163_08800 [bacterium]|nr:hypothetical protein [bacterium]
MAEDSQWSRRALLQLAATAFATGSLTGCGTILYPERRGQPAGDFDWKIVALDAIGLIFFFVPGVVAFAIDFNNGTIYLPPEECARSLEPSTEEFTTIQLPREELNVTAVEEAVSSQTQKEVRLEPGGYQTHKLTNLTHFWQLRRNCQVS